MRTPLPHRVACVCLSLLLAMTASWSARAEPAPDFPPGAFTDGRWRSLETYRGQVVVLFFYEQNCPSCRKTIPERNALVAQYKGKPVQFFAIAAGDSLAEAKRYQQATRLAMPVFADNLNVMERRYGTKISLQNIYQFRVLGPDGEVVSRSMSAEAIDRALEGLDSGSASGLDASAYHEGLADVFDAIAEQDYEVALRKLRPMQSSRDEALKQSAESLEADIQAKGQAMLDGARALVETDPVAAMRAFDDVEDAFGRAEPGAEARKELRALSSLPAVKEEMAARKMFARLAQGMAKATDEQRTDVAQFAASIYTKYPDTPTGQRAKELAEQIAR